MLDQGKLHERVFALFHAGTTLASAREALERLSHLPRPPASLGNGMLFAGGAKLYMDGSGGARTGPPRAPKRDAPLIAGGTMSE